MRAIAAHAYGGAEQLKLVDLPKPQPDVGEALVRVKAAGVNTVDTMILSGYMPKNIFPLIPGWDFAGVVESVGEGVTDVVVGGEVYGYKVGAVEGTFAEYVSVPVAWLSPKPSALSFVQAAGVPCVGLTAYQTLVDRLNVQAGETVLITAAAGGVGSLAVQIAVALGAHVVGTASTRNHDYLRRLGAEHVIDYREGDWVEAVRALYPNGVDVAFSCISGETKLKSPGALRDGGRLAWISGEEPLGPPMERGIAGYYSFGMPRRDTFDSLSKLASEGKLTVPVEQVFPLEEAGRAFERVGEGEMHGQVRAGHVQGKLIIAVDAAEVP